MKRPVEQLGSLVYFAGEKEDAPFREGSAILPPAKFPIVRRLRHLRTFLRHLWRAQTWYNIHSPFVFDFASQVLEDDRWFYAFDEVEHWRRQLLRDRTLLTIDDHGAGSQLRASRERSIASLARHSACQPFQGRWLFRIVNRYKPSTMLELGTSLGISTAYQALAAPRARFLTVEGCGASAQVARNTLRHFSLKNVELVEGRFEERLPVVLADLGKLDYLYVDGNHRYEPTVSYFEQCLQAAHDDSVFIFDDIHWSEEMEQAWEHIRRHPAVRLSIDLYFIGLVFFKDEFPVKQDFTLIPWRWKPWAVGWW